MTKPTKPHPCRPGRPQVGDEQLPHLTVPAGTTERLQAEAERRGLLTSELRREYLQAGLQSSAPNPAH